MLQGIFPYFNQALLMSDRNMKNIADGLRGHAAEAAHAEAIDFLKRSFAG